MKIVVTGANGWIGREVCNHIRQQGGSALAVDVHPESLIAGFKYIKGDIGSDRIYEIAKHVAEFKAQSVIHCAGHVHKVIETEEEIVRFNAVNKEGTRRVITLALNCGIRRIVYASTIALYKGSESCGSGEEDPVECFTAYANSKLAGEVLCRESDMDWRIARLGTVFGVGDRANFAKLAKALGQGRFLLPGTGCARKSILPLKLAAALLTDYANLNTTKYRVVNMALPKAPTLAEICDTFSEVCGFPKARRVPKSILQQATRIGDLVSHIVPSFPYTSRAFAKLVTSTCVQTDRMCELWPERKWGTFQDWLASDGEYYRRQVVGGER